MLTRGHQWVRFRHIRARRTAPMGSICRPADVKVRPSDSASYEHVWRLLGCSHATWVGEQAHDFTYFDRPAGRVFRVL